MSVLLKSVPLMIAGALASGALGACGGSDSKASADTSQGNEQQILTFTRCMREHGVNISTPNGPGGGPVKVTGTTPQVMEAAQKACARYQPQGGAEKLSPAERARREDQVREFARCMREHGVEVQTQTSNGDVRIGINANGVRPESPAFQAAQKACESYLPKPPGGRTGGPGRSGGGPSTDSGHAPRSGGGYSLGLNAGK
jgi:hypothetical protein